MSSRSPGHRDLFSHDPDIGHRFVPSTKIRIPHEGGGYLVATNADGFRCRHEITAARNTGRRILLFGDSYTAGEGVSNAKRFGDVAESLLPDTEVLNFGLSASGTDQQYLVYERYREIEHDLVVLALFTENIRRNPCQSRLVLGRDGKYYYALKPWFELANDGRLVRRGIPVPAEVHAEPVGRAWGNRAPRRARWLADRLTPEMKDWIQRLTRHQPSPEYGDPRGYEWRLMRQILVEWNARSRVPFVIMLLPWYMYIEGSASFRSIERRFGELHRDTGIPVLNVLAALQARDAAARRSLRYRADSHYTPAAHQIIGEFLAQQLAPYLR